MLGPARISKIQMATGQPANPDSNCDRDVESVVLLEEDQTERDSLDHNLLADRRVEIEGEEKLKLHLKVWEDDKKEELLKIESYRGRCIAAMAEFYQLMGFYLVFQGVVFSAVCNRSKLSCRTAVLPASLSLLTSIATAYSIRHKLSFYEIEKSKFITAEWDVSNLINKINKLKGQGKDFKFEEIDDPNSDSKKKDKTKKLNDAMKGHRSFYTAAMCFLLIFSCIIFASCFAVVCPK